MAENLDNPGFGNFSIQDTMEMGMGNAELLSDLLGPDSATSNPDDIKDINDILYVFIVIVCKNAIDLLKVPETY